MGAMSEEKRGILSDEQLSESSNDSFVSRSRRDNHRAHPLRDLLKSAGTICWVGLLIYGMAGFFNSTYFLFDRSE